MRVIVTLSSAVSDLHFTTATHTYTGHSKAKVRGGTVPTVNVLTTQLLVTTLTNVYSLECTYRDKEKTVSRITICTTNFKKKFYTSGGILKDFPILVSVPIENKCIFANTVDLKK